MLFFLFDILPLEDVIHETIMPMLDYESRIVLNHCLAPNERYSIRFSKDEIIRHELFIISNILRTKLDNIEDVDGPTRKLRMRKKSQLLIQLLHCFEPGNRNLLILHHYPALHRTVIHKLTQFSNPTSDYLSDASRYFRQKISELAKRLFPHIQNIVPTPNPTKGILKPICVKGFMYGVYYLDPLDLLDPYTHKRSNFDVTATLNGEPAIADAVGYTYDVLLNGVVKFTVVLNGSVTPQTGTDTSSCVIVSGDKIVVRATINPGQKKADDPDDFLFHWCVNIA